MSYRQPGITVTQNFVNALPALATFSLPNVIVGPIYQIVTSALQSTTYTGAAYTTQAYSGLPVGGLVDTRVNSDLINFPVTVNFENTIVKYGSGTSAGFTQLDTESSVTVDSTGLILTKSGATFETDGLIPGSLITVSAPSGAVGTYTVATVNSQTSLTLTSALLGSTTSVSTVAFTGWNGSQFGDATSEAFQYAVAGDIITIATGGNAGTYTIRSVTSANSVIINQTFAASGTSIAYTLSRNIGTVNIPTTTAGVTIGASTFTLPSALTTAITNPTATPPITSASVYMTYRAQILNYSNDLTEIDTTTDLEGTFGAAQIVPYNPVVYGAFLALNNSITAVNVLGLDNNYFSNELLSYDNAFGILALNDIYAISVMTQSTTVHTALQTHVDGYSAPAEKLERVGIINRTLVTTQTIDGPFTGATIDVTGLVLTKSSATFITDGVGVGDYVNVTAPSGAIGTYEIAAVNSQTSLTLATALAGSTISVSTIAFNTYENLSLTEQASTLAAYATSFADRRMVMTWPDQVKVPNGNTIMTVPGYFLNCSVGALTTGLPTQQGLTNLNVAVYTGVIHSTKYFTNDQLNTIAGGGVMIFVQDVLNVTPLYIRHQLTTNTSAITFQEYSVTKNVDFIAKFIRQQHPQFIGQYNIVPSTFDDLKTNAQAIMNYLTTGTLLPKIGGVITDGKLTSIVQDPDNIDGILETWSIDIPIPLNNLDFTLNIS